MKNTHHTTNSIFFVRDENNEVLGASVLGGKGAVVDARFALESRKIPYAVFLRIAETCTVGSPLVPLYYTASGRRYRFMLSMERS